MTIAALAPETEAPPDPGALESLLANQATHRGLLAFEIDDEASVDLYQLIPLGEHAHPFVIVAHDYESDAVYQLFATHRAAEHAYARWVDHLRDQHREWCDADCACGEGDA